MSRCLLWIFILPISFSFWSCESGQPRVVESFNDDWKFYLGDDSLAYQYRYDDASWRVLNVPHDWSIEGSFDQSHSTGQAGGGLPAGIGWYRKSFHLTETDRDRKIFVQFDGIYRNSEVWINEHRLGRRPNGYISFEYDLTPYLRFDTTNVLAVKVDNSLQPNSRWYTGSGIYREVRLVKTNKTYVPQWGTFVTTPDVSATEAKVRLAVDVVSSAKDLDIEVVTRLLDPKGKMVAEGRTSAESGTDQQLVQEFRVSDPVLWSVDQPVLYQAVTEVFADGVLADRYTTPFGIRSFRFDAEKGFFLNGKPVKILGVNNHHDLGALGAAFNRRAAQRQLEILKAMGCNALRTAHNPPAPELLDLCDEMGFIVMDEAFDAWRKKKAKKDYHLDWDEWHERDLRDMILRDRNHPSIFMWSIGNEIREQFDSSGLTITRELVDIVKSLDTTRPVTCALTENIPEKNFIYQSGALDLLGFNYKQENYDSLPIRFPGGKFLASETNSALATRGHYDMPSDSNRHWPVAHNVPIDGANPDFTVSSYDHVSAYWGSTHEETWKVVKQLDFMAGLYVWSGFDFLGEPVPYPWPARSSYYGVIDLAGFPKDSYFMYQSEWTDDPVLHVFPHWNWEKGQTVDIWAYYNQADEVELFLNGASLGTRSKPAGQFHVMWRVQFTPGVLKAVSKKEGNEVLTREIRTAGSPAAIRLTADRSEIEADGSDLSFITVEVIDKEGTLVPNASHRVDFEIEGPGFIAGVDNGYQASHEPFKSSYCKAWKGKCLVIVQSSGQPGTVILKATAGDLPQAEAKLGVFVPSE